MGNMYENCAFSGHRILGKDFDYNLLDRVVFNLVAGGTKNFFCGMAMGFDIAAAECVLNLKKDNKSLKLTALIPCPEQYEKYSESYKQRYKRILENCDKKIVISNSYYDGCMFERDRMLVDSCDVLVCYIRRNFGGTFYTVNYAKQKNVSIIGL